MRPHGARFLTLMAVAASAAMVLASCSSSSSSSTGGGGTTTTKAPITIGTSLSQTGDFSVDGQAFQRGYNGGHDQYGRTVLNPAGIDLADGAAWDDLRLAGDNAWVSVSYLWTGAGTQGQVRTEGGPLNVRSGPGTGYANVGLAGPYARVPIECQASGEAISGTAGTTALWDRIGPGNYVSHAYVVADGGGAARRC